MAQAIGERKIKIYAWFLAHMGYCREVGVRILLTPFNSRPSSMISSTGHSSSASVGEQDAERRLILVELVLRDIAVVDLFLNTHPSN